MKKKPAGRMKAGPSKPLLCAILLIATSAGTCEATTQAQTSPEGYDMSRGAVERHVLPVGLSEVSGLVVDQRGRLFAHDDETGIVYELNPADGAMLRRFAVGDPTAEADFEGIAALGDDLFLITSRGSLLRFQPGEDRRHVPFERTRTGIGPRCEIEGLTEDPRQNRLLVACKQSRSRELADQVTVFSLDPALDSATVAFTVPWERIREAGGPRAFHPSGIAPTPDGDRYFILSARQRSLLVVDESGTVLGVHSLGRWHLQPEGIAFSKDSTLLISDEAATTQARLSRYRATAVGSGLRAQSGLKPHRHTHWGIPTGG